MSLYRLLSAMLCYPEPELLDYLGELEEALAAYPDAEETLQPLVTADRVLGNLRGPHPLPGRAAV